MLRRLEGGIKTSSKERDYTHQGWRGAKKHGVLFYQTGKTCLTTIKGGICLDKKTCSPNDSKQTLYETEAALKGPAERGGGTLTMQEDSLTCKPEPRFLLERRSTREKGSKKNLRGAVARCATLGYEQRHGYARRERGSATYQVT